MSGLPAIIADHVVSTANSVQFVPAFSGNVRVFLSSLLLRHFRLGNAVGLFPTALVHGCSFGSHDECNANGFVEVNMNVLVLLGSISAQVCG